MVNGEVNGEPNGILSSWYIAGIPGWLELKNGQTNHQSSGGFQAELEVN